jgi:hypothetical protein
MRTNRNLNEDRFERQAVNLRKKSLSGKTGKLQVALSLFIWLLLFGMNLDTDEKYFAKSLLNMKSLLSHLVSKIHFFGIFVRFLNTK